jgi:hypothetical protein
MKTLIKIPAIALGLFLLITGGTQVAKAQYDDVSLQTFYDELSPYGTWINDPEYGYVWRPDVDQSDFRPYYTNGRWAMTEYGNTWVSNYDWGWAPFHYGRWTYNRYNNWVWIPDTVWGPAWVNWRSGGGYYGWSPMAPRVGVHVNLGIVDFWWNFVPYNNIYVNAFPRYYSGRNRVYVQNTVIINNTYVRNNRTYYTGPRVDDIRRHTNQRVTIYNLNRSERAGASRIDRNTVNVYSPRPSRNTDNRNAAPKNAVQANISKERVDTRRENNFGRENRGNVSNNGRTDRNGNNGTDSREGNGRTPRVENSVGNENSNRGGIIGRDRERGEVNNSNAERTPRTTAPQRDTNRENSTHVGIFGRARERSEPTSSNSPAPQRRNSAGERTGSMPTRSVAGNEGRTQSAPQRSAERPQVQRAERPQQSSQGSNSSSSNSSRGASRGESGARPGRG